MAGTPEQARINGRLGGRPKGIPRGPAQRMWQQYIDMLIRTENSPGHIMIKNMLFWNGKVQTLEMAVAKLLQSGPMSPDLRERLVGLLERYNEARDKAMFCAEKAAPYIHPKLASISLQDAPDVEITDIESLTDDKLAEIVTRGMRAAMEQHEAGMVNVTPGSYRQIAKRKP